MSILFNPYELYVPRNTSLALSMSLIAHAVAFAIGWKLYQQVTPPIVKPSLSVVLVSRKTHHAPKTARSWAQANLEGGGRPDHKGHTARTNALDNPTQQDPTPLQTSQNSHTEAASSGQNPSQPATPEPTNPYLTRQGKTTLALQNPEASQDLQTPQPQPAITPPAPPPATINIAGKLSQSLDAAQEGRSSKVLGASTREYRFASYLEGWRSKVERVGTEHYRSVIAGRKLYGALVIQLKVRATGVVEKITIQRGSGNPELDKIATEIIQRASPFDPFPDTLRAETQVMEITRTYTFHKDQNNGHAFQAGER